MEFTHKNAILPSHVDPERFLEIFTRIKEQPDQQSKRVEKVLELMSSFRDDLSTREKIQIFTRLRLALGTYRWAVRLGVTREGLHVIHQMARELADATSDAERWEYSAIGLLLEVLPYLGQRPRIRRCADAGCREWFFAAKREDQEFCSGNCRQHHYDSDPESRAAKRRYMRQYRVQEKKRDERRKKDVGFKDSMVNKKRI